jgi:hypothetical protein
MEILALFTLLQIKHYYADFVIQTYEQTVRKGIYRDWVGISHSLDHLSATLFILIIFNFFVPLSVLAILSIALFEFVCHYHIDWFKVHYGCKDMTRGLFWNQFGLDQLAHQLTYILMAWYLLLL